MICFVQTINKQMHAYEKIQTDIAIICFHGKLKKYIDYSVSYKCIGIG